MLDTQLLGQRPDHLDEPARDQTDGETDGQLPGDREFDYALDLFPAERIEKDYAATQTLTRQQRVVFDDALYIDLGGEASEYTAASNGKLTAYMMMHELDFVVTSDEVLEYYKDTFPMEDLEALLPADLREALADQLSFNTDAEGKTTAIALDMTQSRFVAGTGADADPNVQHTYYFFVPAGAPHPEQIVQFLRYSFGL